MRYLLIVALAALSLAASAQQIWKWTDEKGVTHYGTSPPPNAKAVKSDIRNRADMAPDAASRAAQKKEDDKVKAMHLAACQAGARQIRMLQSLPGNYHKDESGTRVYSPEAATTTQIQEAQWKMRQNCTT